MIVNTNSEPTVIYTVWMTNQGWYADSEFVELEAAKAYARSTGFQCKIERVVNGEYESVCTYCPIGGFRSR